MNDFISMKCSYEDQYNNFPPNCEGAGEALGTLVPQQLPSPPPAAHPSEHFQSQERVRGCHTALWGRIGTRPDERGPAATPTEDAPSGGALGGCRPAGTCLGGGAGLGLTAGHHLRAGKRPVQDPSLAVTAGGSAGHTDQHRGNQVRDGVRI